MSHQPLDCMNQFRRTKYNNRKAFENRKAIKKTVDFVGDKVKKTVTDIVP